ncbi:hypothetical protein Q5P01_024504 [Channa striata]|uniref:Uncharacterized protein n=1 Tax=Channa striata TaxID=64152 RepID=A0AA88IQF5_CHASR|nr:hypothetical protein Q5P01_024504 [Channa striata]
MAQKNGNAVAVERRADLASLFCMIGRHGPAVALAVAAVVSVLAAFLIYRTVRGKRRKAAAGAERDAPATRPEREPIPEESLGSVESTDVSDEGSSDTKEADDVIPSRPKIRLRRVPADENKPPPRSPSETDIQPPDYKHFTSDDTQAFQADYQENERVTRDEDVSDEENLQCGSNNLMNSEGSNLEAGTGSINCYGKDKQFEEENHPDNINYNNCSSNNQLCVEEEKNKGVDNEISTTDQDINGDDDGGLAVTSEILDEYHKCTAAKFTTHPPLLDKQEIDAQTSGVVNVLDKEDEIKPPLDKNIDVDVLHFDLLSVKKEIKDEKNETVALADKTIDGKLQHAGQNASNKESKKSSDEKTSVAAAPKADENVTASVVTEDSVLVRPSICQDRQSEHMENYETFDVTRVHSDDAAVCDKAAITPAVTSEKISHPDMPSPFQDQQSDQIQNKDLFLS